MFQGYWLRVGKYFRGAHLTYGTNVAGPSCVVPLPGGMTIGPKILPFPMPKFGADPKYQDLILRACPGPTNPENFAKKIAVGDSCQCWPAAGGGHEGSWRCAWSSSDIRQTRHSGGNSLQLPRLGHPTYFSPAVQNSMLLWLAAWYCLGWTTATLCRMVLPSAIFRSCSVSRTLRRGSPHSCQEGQRIYHCWNSYIGFLFINGSSTSRPYWHSRSVVHQPQRNSPVTSDRLKFHVVFVPPTRLYCTNLLPKLSLLTVQDHGLHPEACWGSTPRSPALQSRNPCLPYCRIPFHQQFLHPPMLPSLLLLEVGPLNPARWFGERSTLPSGVWAEPQSKSNLLHFSFKIAHLVATISMIFLRINFQNFVQFNW